MAEVVTSSLPVSIPHVSSGTELESTKRDGTVLITVWKLGHCKNHHYVDSSRNKIIEGKNKRRNEY